MLYPQWYYEPDELSNTEEISSITLEIIDEVLSVLDVELLMVLLIVDVIVFVIVLTFVDTLSLIDELSLTHPHPVKKPEISKAPKNSFLIIFLLVNLIYPSIILFAISITLLKLFKSTSTQFMLN